MIEHVKIIFNAGLLHNGTAKIYSNVPITKNQYWHHSVIMSMFWYANVSIMFQVRNYKELLR